MDIELQSCGLGFKACVECFYHVICHLACIADELQVCKTHYKFITAKTAAETSVTGQFLDGFCNKFEYIVTALVPILIVEMLEIVQVDEHKSVQRSSGF